MNVDFSWPANPLIKEAGKRVLWHPAVPLPRRSEVVNLYVTHKDTEDTETEKYKRGDQGTVLVSFLVERVTYDENGQEIVDIVRGSVYPLESHTITRTKAPSISLRLSYISPVML